MAKLSTEEREALYASGALQVTAVKDSHKEYKAHPFVAMALHNQHGDYGRTCPAGQSRAMPEVIRQK